MLDIYFLGIAKIPIFLSVKLLEPKNCSDVSVLYLEKGVKPILYNFCLQLDIIKWKSTKQNKFILECIGYTQFSKCGINDETWPERLEETKLWCCWFGMDHLICLILIHIDLFGLDYLGLFDLDWFGHGLILLSYGMTRFE